MILTPHEPEAAALADARAAKIILAAIGDFAGATGNLGRIANPVERLKVLDLLVDFVDHLAATFRDELARHPLAAAQTIAVQEEQP